MAFEAANTRIENKVLDSDSVYVNMNTYTDLRTLDTSLYENIDFFETQYKQGGFSYNEIASLSGISADYAKSHRGGRHGGERRAYLRRDAGARGGAHLPRARRNAENAVPPSGAKQ